MYAFFLINFCEILFWKLHALKMDFVRKLRNKKRFILKAKGKKE